MAFITFYALFVFVLKCCLCSVNISSESYCTAIGDSNTQHVDSGTSVSVSCAVDNPSPGANLLTWTIPSFGVSVGNINGANASDDDQPDFRSTVNSFDNTEDTTDATLTFPAVIALDGAVVFCADVTEASSNCTLSIVSDVTSPPLGISCSNINTTHITLSWEQPTDNVGQFLEYIISTSSTNSPQRTLDTNYAFNDLSPFTQYTFTVRTNNSIGLSNVADIECTTRGEVFDPLSVADIKVCLTNNSGSSYVLVNVTSQPCPPSTPRTANFTNFTITISGYDPINTTSCQYEQSISIEMDYNITITVNNEEGSSEPTTVLFDAHLFRDVNIMNDMLTYSIPHCVVPENALAILNITCINDTNTVLQRQYNTPIDISSIDYAEDDCDFTLKIGFNSSTTTPTVATVASSFTAVISPSPSGTTPTISTTTDPQGTGTAVDIVPIVGGVIGGVILILVIVIAVIVGIILYKKCSSDESDGAKFIGEVKGERSDPIPLVQKNIPETGQPALYQDPSTIEREKAPTGDLYALPEKGSKQRRPPPAGPKNELPTYQDPNTIQRQMAPSGDMYAMPEKNKHHVVGGMYAELDHMGPTSPTQQPLLHETRPQPHQPIVYSAVRHN